MRSMAVGFVLLVGLVAGVAIATTATSVKGLFAKYQVNWGHIVNYEGRYTVQGILHMFFPNENSKKVLSELGFQRGVIPSDEMLDSLRRSVENNPEIIATKDWQEPLSRLAISTKTERMLVELTETLISADESLSSGQKTNLRSALALRDSYTVNSPEKIAQVIKAVREYDRQKLASLIDGGFDPNLPIVSGMPLLGFAARMLATMEGSAQQDNVKYNDSIEQLRWLAEHPSVDLNATDNQGRNFIGMAAKQGSFEALKIALTMGMDVNSVNDNGDSPLLTVIRFGSSGRWRESVKLLVEDYNASIDLSNVWGTTALHEIVLIESRWGGHELTNYFLDRGADINAESRLAGRPLDIATREKNAQMVALLLKRGAKGALYPNGAPHRNTPKLVADSGALARDS